jgi:hypothetical protein
MNLPQPKWKMTGPGNLVGKAGKMGTKIDASYKYAIKKKMW